MRDIQNLIRANGEAAGREAAHAMNDGDTKVVRSIFSTIQPGNMDDFARGWIKGRDEK